MDDAAREHGHARLGEALLQLADERNHGAAHPGRLAPAAGRTGDARRGADRGRSRATARACASCSPICTARARARGRAQGVQPRAPAAPAAPAAARGARASRLLRRSQVGRALRRRSARHARGRERPAHGAPPAPLLRPLASGSRSASATGFVRFSLTPRAERKYGFGEVLIQLFGAVTCLTAVAVLVARRGARARRHRDAAPVRGAAGATHAGRHLRVLSTSLRQIALEDQPRAFETSSACSSALR